jgi:hypothetical protein
VNGVCGVVCVLAVDDVKLFLMYLGMFNLVIP